jgi:plasmid stabilization system protein ParE
LSIIRIAEGTGGMTAKQTFRVVWTRTAEADLEAIIDFIADDSVDAALAVFTRIREL